MLGVNRDELNKVAEQLAILAMNLTDASGQRVIAATKDLSQYPAAVMAALVMLTGGAAIHYQGTTFIKNVGEQIPGIKTQEFTIEDPAWRKHP